MSKKTLKERVVSFLIITATFWIIGVLMYFEMK